MFKDVYETVISWEHLDVALLGALGITALAGLINSYRSLPPPDETDDMLMQDALPLE